MMTESMPTGEVKADYEVAREALNTGIDVAVRASRLVMEYWPSPANAHFNQATALEVIEKNEGTGNYATVADTASEQLIIKAIQGNPVLNGHKIIAEESNPIGAESAWQWVIDPIDGTPPFKNGLPEFGISIGLLKDGEPTMGIIAMPAQGQLIASLKGNGVQLMNFDRQVIAELGEAPAVSLDHALVGYDLGYSNRGTQLAETVAKLADQIGYPVSYGSSSTANFRLALGHLGAYFCQTPTKFDIGAASAIITELGGIVTDTSGRPIDWQAPKQSYLAARDPRIHQQVLEIINS